MFSGPAFAPGEDEYRKSIHGQEGGHYNTFQAKDGMEMELLKKIFGEGKANEMNFVLFSTSGIHGSYSTIEEEWDHREERQAEADEYDEEHRPCVTFVIIQPRLATITYGNVDIESQEDADFLKRLRQSSWDVVPTIGKSS